MFPSEVGISSKIHISARLVWMKMASVFLMFLSTFVVAGEVNEINFIDNGSITDRIEIGELVANTKGMESYNQDGIYTFSGHVLFLSTDAVFPHSA